MLCEKIQLSRMSWCFKRTVVHLQFQLSHFCQQHTKSTCCCRLWRRMATGGPLQRVKEIVEKPRTSEPASLHQCLHSIFAWTSRWGCRSRLDYSNVHYVHASVAALRCRSSPFRVFRQRNRLCECPCHRCALCSRWRLYCKCFSLNVKAALL